MRRNRSVIRGVSLLETLIAAGISVGVMGTAIGVYSVGTQGFYNEQTHSYMQGRTRNSLDRMATDARGAVSLLPSTSVTVSVSGQTYTKSYTAADGSNANTPACVILQVPAQDANGLIYNTSGSNANTLVLDTIIYLYNPGDGTLRRTVKPGSNGVRSSYRPPEFETVVSRNVNKLKLLFHDRDGKDVSGTPSVKVASVDIQTQVLGQNNTSGESPLTVSGIRLRNMRSGSIPGQVLKSGSAVPNATVTATFTSTSGAYSQGTVVATTQTDNNGNFELFGLLEGAYTVTVTLPNGSTYTQSNINVASEQAANTVKFSL